MENKESQKKKRIYEDKSLEELPEQYDRDVAKVMIRNPLEAYAFWSVSQQSLNKIKKDLKIENEEVHYRLLVSFKDKSSEELQYKEIELPPKTDNWIIGFDIPPLSLKIELSVYTESGKSMVLFQSATVTAPEPTPSEQLHHEWISPNWNPAFHAEDSQPADSDSEGDSTKPLPSDHEQYDPYDPKNFPGSSGNFLGASEHSPGSSYNPYKR